MKVTMVWNFMEKNTNNTVKDRNLPNLIIIGAQKCATTSLHYYLNLHPQISMSCEKELDFFVYEINWPKGIEWYKSHFENNDRIRGESSPNYTNYSLFNGVPERMHSIVPDAKLIYLLRDPIERIISQYIHHYARGQENGTFTEAITNFDANDYIRRSKYAMQLEQFLRCYPKSQILILTLEDLNQHRQQTMQKIFRFLDVDVSFFSRKYSTIQNKSIYYRRKNRIGRLLAQTPIIHTIEKLPFPIRENVKILLYFPFSRKIERPILNADLRQMLIDHLKDDINRLRDYTGYKFEGWCV